MNEFESFFQAFIETALWCSSDMNNDDEDDTSLENQGYTIEDIHENTLATLETDCQIFFDENYSKIKDALERAGHDFWLTSNRHGAGFWDGDWEKEVGDELTKDSHQYSERSFYVLDGKIHCD